MGCGECCRVARLVYCRWPMSVVDPPATRNRASSVYAYVSTYTHAYTCMFIRACADLHVFKCVYASIHIYTYTYTYTHVYNDISIFVCLHA